MAIKNTEQLQRSKSDFLLALEKFNGDKKKAADSIGVNLVEVRSWRHADPAFNMDYKARVVGSAQSRVKSDLKGPFIELLENGLSQRQACEELNISITTLRTWKKVDADFKKLCLDARFGDES